MKQSTGSRKVILICFILALSFMVSTLYNNTSGASVSRQYVKDMVQLSGNSIDSRLAYTFSMPYLYSKSMAESSVLQNWAKNEETYEIGSVKYTSEAKKLSDYLNSFHEDGYSCAFYISTRTQRYYYYDGYDYTLSKKNAGDQWFFDFLQSDRDYQYTLATDNLVSEKPENVILVDYKMYDTNGKVAAVVGLGIETAKIEKIMDEISSSYGLSACFIDREGNVQLSCDEDAVKGSNVFTDGFLKNEKGQLKAREGVDTGFWIKNHSGVFNRDYFCSVRYIDGFNWYLLTYDKNADMMALQRQQSSKTIWMNLVWMFLILLLITEIIRKYRLQITEIETTDELTGIANRKAFIQYYIQKEKWAKFQNGTMFLLDIDTFKKINDQYGHNGGDEALSSLAYELQLMIQKSKGGFIGRWGGDEFIGVVYEDREGTAALLQGLQEKLKLLSFENGMKYSVSVGVTRLFPHLGLFQNVKCADDALYMAKRNGRAQVQIYPQEKTPEVDAFQDVQQDQQMQMYLKLKEESSKKTTDRTILQWRQENQKEIKWLDAFMYAVNGMLPFAAGGGILIAVSYLMDIFSFDFASMSAQMRLKIGTLTQASNVVNVVGNQAFNFMFPVFAAFLALGLGGQEALLAGFIGGYVAMQNNGGFAGAALAGILAGGIVNLIRHFLHEMPTGLKKAAPILIYPVFSLALVNMVMVYLVTPMISALASQINALLTMLDGKSHLAVCTVSAVMMAFDLGGPVNKAAYFFAKAGLSQREYYIMAAVMLGGMVPPCGIALAAMLFRGKFAEGERKQAPITMIMGLTFITEGAIPYAVRDLKHVLPACMLGSATAGFLSALMDCRSFAPHGGIFSFLLVNHPIRYLIAFLAGALVTALYLGVVRKKSTLF